MNRTAANWTGLKNRADKFTAENRKKYVEDFIDLVEGSDILDGQGNNIPGQIMFRRLKKNRLNSPNIDSIEYSDEDQQT